MEAGCYKSMEQGAWSPDAAGQGRRQAQTWSKEREGRGVYSGRFG